MKALIYPLIAVVFCPLTFPSFADTSTSTTPPIPSLLVDSNGDGAVEIIAFGDSLTRGVGDFIEAGEDIEGGSLTSIQREAGYPLRVESHLGIGVTNAGVPGEEATVRGIARFASYIPAASPDVVIIGGGANDAIYLTAAGSVYNALQAMVNIAFASGVTPVVITIARPCCYHAGYASSVDTYNYEIRRLALINGIRIADIAQGFENICGETGSCRLINLPEGLHPNIDGYDIAGEIVAGQLLGVDVLMAGGAAQLEAALGLAAGSVRTLPTPTIMSAQ